MDIKNLTKEQKELISEYLIQETTNIEVERSKKLRQFVEGAVNGDVLLNIYRFVEEAQELDRINLYLDNLKFMIWRK